MTSSHSGLLFGATLYTKHTLVKTTEI